MTEFKMSHLGFVTLPLMMNHQWNCRIFMVLKAEVSTDTSIRLIKNFEIEDVFSTNLDAFRSNMEQVLETNCVARCNNTILIILRLDRQVSTVW